MSRTREQFGGLAGVGGLGFAPRRSKISPIYDEARAREAMADQRLGAEQAINFAASKNEADLRASVLKRKNDAAKARIAELNAAKQAMGDGDTSEIDAAIAKLSAEQTLTPQEELSVRKTSRDSALQDFRNLASETGPGDRTARQFMSRRQSEKSGEIDDDSKKEYIKALRKAALADDPEVEPEPPIRPPFPPVSPEITGANIDFNRILPPAPAAPPAPASPAGASGSGTQRRTGPPPPSVPTDLELFNRMMDEEEEKYPTSPTPLREFPGAPFYEMPETMSDLIFGGGVVPPEPEGPPAPIEPPVPASKVSDIEIDIAEDNDSDIYRKALEYWKTSPDKRISTNPPAYFAGKKPGEKVIPGEGQREMVRAYLEQYADEEDKESNKITIKGGKLDPDLAREAEGEVANLYKKVSSVDAYIETLDPTEQEKQELYNAYQDRTKDVGPMSDREVADLYIQKLNEMRGKNKPKSEGSQGSKKPKTRSEAYASNLLKIISTGKDLADKPAKLARIAKPDLSEKERSKVVPEHILLVDKLYNINKGRSGAFKSTYDEIERVYKTDDKKKKAALEYLAAKEILTSEMA
jgi:hypothetical protein